MARGRTQRAASVGVAANGSSTVLVTVAPDGALLDRRRLPRRLQSRQVVAADVRDDLLRGLERPDVRVEGLPILGNGGRSRAVGGVVVDGGYAS